MPVARQTIDAPGAPPALGPYSHAVRTGNLLFCSMQIPLDPGTGEVEGATAPDQARRCLANLEAICEAAGAALQDAVKLTLYLTDLSAFAEVNEVYGSFFSSAPPARAAIGVSALPRGVQVAIDAVVPIEDNA